MSDKKVVRKSKKGKSVGKIKAQTRENRTGGRNRPKRGKLMGSQVAKERVSHLGDQVKKAKMIAQAEGARGVDPRSSGLAPANALGGMAMPQLDHSVDILATPNINAIQSLCLGPVLAAIKKGWLSQFGAQNGSITAYSAWTYLIQSIISCSQGTYPTIQSAPEWYWQICDAIKPKTVPFKTGSASYKMSPAGPLDFVPNSTWAYSAGNAWLVFGTPDTTTLINGMPVIVPTIYNPANGFAALQSMFDFFPESLMCSRAGATKVPYLSDDVSAFSGCYSEWGFDAAGINGLAASISSEVKIQSPLLAKLCSYDNLRGYADIRKSSGSPIYTIQRMMEMTDYKQLHNKGSPIFKYYNFDRYFEILSLAIGCAMAVMKTAQIGTGPVVCPLTPQQVQILLRQAILPLFANEMAQDLVLDDQTGLTPFATTLNGYASPGSNMLLPSFLVEAIRSVMRKTIQTSAQFDNYQLDYVPVLCRSYDVLQLNNYTWDNGNEKVYTDDPAEIPVNLIDMSCNVQNVGQQFLLPECGANFEKLEEWNQFMKDIEAAIAGTSEVGSEKGITCLSSIFFSDFSCQSNPPGIDVGPLPPQGKQHKVIATTNSELKKQVSKKQVKELGTARKMRVKQTPEPGPGSGYYTGVNIVSTATNVAENGPEWKYQRLIPHAYNYSWGEGDSFVSRRQVFQSEAFKIAHTTQAIYDGPNGDVRDLGQSLFQLHLAAAHLCVRGQLSAESEVERDIRVMGEAGRGGFLSSIAGFLAEDVFGVKGGKAFANQIGNLVGL